MSKPKTCWPIRNHFQISYNTNAVMKYEIHSYTCANPPSMYIKVVMNMFFIVILFAKILTLEFIGLHPYMYQIGSQE